MIKDTVKSFLIEKKFDESVFFWLEKYVQLLLQWRKKHNVVSTSFTDEEVWLNVYDSLYLSGWIAKNSALNGELIRRIYDAGSGGGFPGIPLAIIFPKLCFSLVEINRKKCSFLRTVKSALNLSNVTIGNVDVATLEDPELILSKAAFSPAHITKLGEIVSPGGMLVLWGTEKTAVEFSTRLAEIDLSLIEKIHYQLPARGARCLLIFKKNCY